MNDKLIDFRVFSEALGTGNRSLGTTSPSPIISGPTTTLFYDLRGTACLTSIPSVVLGTLDRWRSDKNDSLQLNRDQWFVWTTGTATLVRVMEVEKSLIPNHWTDKLPSNEVEYPKWVKELIYDKGLQKQ